MEKHPQTGIGRYLSEGVLLVVTLPVTSAALGQFLPGEIADVEQNLLGPQDLV